MAKKKAAKSKTKKTTKKTVKKTASKKIVKKATATKKKKVTKKKAPAKKTATKKKTPAKKPVKKTAAKKASKKTVTKKKPATKKTVTKKAAAKKTAPKKAAKKTPAKEAAAAPKKITKVVKKTAVKAVKMAKVKKSSPAVKTTVRGAKTVRVAGPTKRKPATKSAVQNVPDKLDFDEGDYVVYPAHGVGFVEGVETQTIAGLDITLYTICFDKDRMRLKLPVTKVKESGLRKLSSKDRLKDALSTLRGRAHVRRIMWSRRAQEYETKINSGDPVSIAEVLRDLRKNNNQNEQSYSERQIYQAALERLAREVAAIEKIDEQKAAEKLEAVMSDVA